MRAFAGSSVRISLLASLTLPLAMTAGVAQAKDYVAWLYANQPDTGDYNPDPQYSFNSAGGPILVSGGVVNLYGLENTSPTNVQDSAVGPSGWCDVTSAPRSTPTAVVLTVSCYNTAGKPGVMPFTLLYQARSAPFGGANQGEAYFLDGMPLTKGTYQVGPGFNSTGGTNTVTANRIGDYTATLPGLTGHGGEPQVTGFSGGEGVPSPRCKLATWGTGASSASVTVACFDKTGAVHNGSYYLAYSVGRGLGVAAGNVMPAAWAWVNNGKDTNVYTPDAQYQFNGFNSGHLTAQKTGTGLYTVTIPGTITYSSSVALVTATGPGNGYCNLAGAWTTNAIFVACFAQGGAPADSPFEVSFQTKQ